LNIKLIVTDLDNTLLRRDKTVSDYTRDVFARCRERGVRVAFATARSIKSVQSFTEFIAVDGLCIINGASVFADDRLLVRYTFDKATQKAFTAELKAEPSVYRISAKTGELDYYLGRKRREFETEYDFPDDCTVDFMHLSYSSPTPEVPLALLQKYDGIIMHRTTGEELVDINPIDATKRNAIVTLCEHWGIMPSEVAVFGDDYNDVDMLSLPGVVSVAVSNAIPEVKAVASHVCGDCDECGVARWLDENVLIS
jgi:Cof subfamily protein (haloacid dehalogenase superfamily)